ncbi:MAG: base excision DNA repair protein [Candidatus Korobacteraceae bacterium]
MKRKSPEAMVRAIYRRLARAWGPQHWWPAETPFEVIAGAILTQNTSWKNVERALANLRTANLLHVAGIGETPLARLEELVRPSGYFRQKAQRLKGFATFVDARYDGSLEKMFAVPTAQLRTELLALKGIGPETADGILLYAGNHEIFVVDAYARRVLERHEALKKDAKYDEVRQLVERALDREEAADTARLSASRPEVHDPSVMSRLRRSRRTQVYNEMHGLFVQVGKHYCHKKSPQCAACSLGKLLPFAPKHPGAPTNKPIVL